MIKDNGDVSGFEGVRLRATALAIVQEQGTGLRRYTAMPGSAPDKIVGRERLGVALELGR